MAHFVCILMKTQQNLRSRCQKSIAGWIRKVESHIILPHQLTANYFAHLNKNNFLKVDNKIGQQKLTCLPDPPDPPKYQNSPFKVAEQPLTAIAPSPYSNERLSLILPKSELILTFWKDQLTIEINEHRHVVGIRCTQNQDGRRGLLVTWL